MIIFNNFNNINCNSLRIINYYYSISIVLLVITTLWPIAKYNSDPELLPIGKNATSALFYRDSPLLRSRKRISSSSSTTAKLSPDILVDNMSSSIMPLPPSMISNDDGDGDQQQNYDFITDRVKMRLECRPKSMLMLMNFSEPFRGVVSVGKSSFNTFEHNQECALRGDGRKSYSLQIFHNRCLTQFDKKQGKFINTLFVRYHPTLETGGDYSKTLICKFSLINFSVN